MALRFSSVVKLLCIELTYLQIQVSQAFPVPDYTTEHITVEVYVTSSPQPDTTLTVTDCSSTHTQYPDISPATGLNAVVSSSYKGSEHPPGLFYGRPKTFEYGSVYELASQVEAETVVLETEVPSSAGTPAYGLPYYGPITSSVVWGSLPIQSASATETPGTTGVSCQISPCVAVSRNWSTHTYTTMISRFILY